MKTRNMQTKLKLKAEVNNLPNESQWKIMKRKIIRKEKF